MKLTSAEWKVMNRLWSDPPMTARRVLDGLADDPPWAYTTVKTIMNRLVEKGVLGVRLDGNTSVYEPRLNKLQARLAAVRSLVETAFGGTPGPLIHMLMDEESLAPDERDELLRKLETMDEDDGSGQG